MERYNNIIEFKEISSTNDYAMELLSSKDVPDFTIIKTEYQTKGRGQRGNYWISDCGENLLFSVILHPIHIQPNMQFVLSQCVSLALVEILSLFCENVCIKWPNDIYVNNNKICGILIENIIEGKQLKSSVFGIGLNINQTSFQEVPNPTSLKLECGIEHIDRDEILSLFMQKFADNYNNTFNNIAGIRKRYHDKLYLLDKESLFKDINGLYRGTIVSVADDGKISILDTNGKNREYYFKEVEYIRE